jgi:hypothetical protein
LISGIAASQAAWQADLSHAEALLVTQAQTLDAIFHKLARDASKSNNMTALEAQLRLL